MISIVIPLYNEESVLPPLIRDLLPAFQAIRDEEIEILLCENGSSDRTFELAWEAAQTYPNIRVLSSAAPSYGKALKMGIAHAGGDLILIFNADFWSIDFARYALESDRDWDMLVGSKLMVGAKDRRPFIRRLITRVFNYWLRVCLGFKGTDTHGIKCLKKESIKPLAALCRTDREIFDTEIVLRAERAGLRVLEIPVQVNESRPSRYSLVKRIPATLSDLWSLYWSIRCAD